MFLKRNEVNLHAQMNVNPSQMEPGIVEKHKRKVHKLLSHNYPSQYNGEPSSKKEFMIMEKWVGHDLLVQAIVCLSKNAKDSRVYAKQIPRNQWEEFEAQENLKKRKKPEFDSTFSTSSKVEVNSSVARVPKDKVSCRRETSIEFVSRSDAVMEIAEKAIEKMQSVVDEFKEDLSVLATSNRGGGDAAVHLDFNFEKKKKDKERLGSKRRKVADDVSSPYNLKGGGDKVRMVDMKRVSPRQGESKKLKTSNVVASVAKKKSNISALLYNVSRFEDVEMVKPTYDTLPSAVMDVEEAEAPIIRRKKKVELVKPTHDSLPSVVTEVEEVVCTKKDYKDNVRIVKNPVIVNEVKKDTGKKPDKEEEEERRALHYAMEEHKEVTAAEQNRDETS